MESISEELIMPKSMYRKKWQSRKPYSRSFSGREVLLKNVKKGDFFRRTPDANTTFIKGDYFRDGGFNKYGASDAEDMNREVFLKGNTKVWVDFTY